MDSDRLPDWTLSVIGCGEGARSIVRLGMVDARDCADGRTFIAAQGFGAQVEPSEMRRFTLIARRLRARIVVVETPGFGVGGSRLLQPERDQLRTGDFGPLGARLFDAAMQVIDDVDDGRLSFLGYSLGASLAGAMTAAATARGWAVDGLVLVEAVALARWSLDGLLIATKRERHWDAAYLDMNHGYPEAPAVGHPVNIRRHTHQLIDQMALGAALRFGDLVRQVQSLSPAPYCVVVVRAEESALTASVRPSVAALRASGMRVSDLVVGGHHGFWHSLPLVARFADELRRSLLEPGAVLRS